LHRYLASDLHGGYNTCNCFLFTDNTYQAENIARALKEKKAREKKERADHKKKDMAAQRRTKSRAINSANLNDDDADVNNLVDNMLGKMKQRDANDVLESIKKNDRHVRDARKSMSPQNKDKDAAAVSGRRDRDSVEGGYADVGVEGRHARMRTRINDLTTQDVAFETARIEKFANAVATGGTKDTKDNSKKESSKKGGLFGGVFKGRSSTGGGGRRSSAASPDASPTNTNTRGDSPPKPDTHVSRKSVAVASASPSMSPRGNSASPNNTAAAVVGADDSDQHQQQRQHHDSTTTTSATAAGTSSGSPPSPDREQPAPAKLAQFLGATRASKADKKQRRNAKES
jgi:hypothetical protein